MKLYYYLPMYDRVSVTVCVDGICVSTEFYLHNRNKHRAGLEQYTDSDAPVSPSEGLKNLLEVELQDGKDGYLYKMWEQYHATAAAFPDSKLDQFAIEFHPGDTIDLDAGHIHLYHTGPDYRGRFFVIIQIDNTCVDIEHEVYTFKYPTGTYTTVDPDWQNLDVYSQRIWEHKGKPTTDVPGWEEFATNDYLENAVEYFYGAEGKRYRTDELRIRHETGYREFTKSRPIQLFITPYTED